MSRARSVKLNLPVTEFEVRVVLDALLSIRSKTKTQAIMRNRTAERIAKRACGILGHDMVDDSIATPDHGNMSWHCTRCGGGNTTWLY